MVGDGIKIVILNWGGGLGWFCCCCCWGWKKVELLCGGGDIVKDEGDFVGLVVCFFRLGCCGEFDSFIFLFKDFIK